MNDGGQIRIWIGVGIVAAFLLWLLRDALMPFVAGMAIAYFLDPLVDRLEARRVNRGIGAALVLVAFLILLLGFLFMLAPMIYQQASGFLERLPHYMAQANERMTPQLEALKNLFGIESDFPQRLAEAARARAGDIAQWLASAVGGVVSGGLAVFDVIATIVLMPVVAFYLLRDWDILIARIDSWLPRRYVGTIRALASDADRTIAGYVRGQALVCISLGLFYAIGLAAVGLEFGLVIGLTAGVISFIPFVGTLVGGILAIGTALAQFPPDWIRVGIVIGIFVVGQALEGNVLSPKLVGDRVGLHPVWIIFALLAGGALFGFTGVLLAVPVAAVIGVMCRHFLKRYLASPFYDAGPAPGASQPPTDDKP